MGGAGALAFSARLASRLGIWARPPGCPCWRWEALLLVNALLRRARQCPPLFAGGGVAHLLQLDLREAQRHAHPGRGVMALAAERVPAGNELPLAGFASSTCCIQPTALRHYPHLDGDGEQAREAVDCGRSWSLGAGRRRSDGGLLLTQIAWRASATATAPTGCWPGLRPLKPACRGLEPTDSAFSYTPGPEPGQQEISRINRGAAIGSPFYWMILCGQICSTPCTTSQSSRPFGQPYLGAIAGRLEQRLCVGPGGQHVAGLHGQHVADRPFAERRLYGLHEVQQPHRAAVADVEEAMGPGWHPSAPASWHRRPAACPRPALSLHDVVHMGEIPAELALVVDVDGLAL